MFDGKPASLPELPLQVFPSSTFPKKQREASLVRLCRLSNEEQLQLCRDKFKMFTSLSVNSVSFSRANNSREKILALNIVTSFSSLFWFLVALVHFDCH